MKVLIACEYSGTVRDAFIARGHNAISCDLLPTEIPGPHYQGSVLDILNDGFDIMIAHPPCTYLSFAANKYWNTPGRSAKRIEALSFFNILLCANIPKICIENPIGCADLIIRKHDQIIHPYYFGESAYKRTCLWLKNLPKLSYDLEDNLFTTRSATDKPEPVYIDKSGKHRHFVDAVGGYKGEGSSFKKRSKFFKSVAEAMAEQWT